MKKCCLFALALTLAGLTSAPQAESKFPLELTKSCANKQVGDACHFSRLGGVDLKGHCEIYQEELVCHTDPLPTIGEPSQLLAPCKSKELGDSCSISSEGGNVTSGTCLVNKQGHLMCAEYQMAN